MCISKILTGLGQLRILCDYLKLTFEVDVEQKKMF